MTGHGRTQHPALKLLLAIEPALQTPETRIGKLESVEDDATVAYCERWEREQRERFPGRRTWPLVLKTDGRTALISRFLRPIAPPEDMGEIEVLRLRGEPRAAASLATRIVSLIPFIPDPILFPGMPDIWSTCDEFLNMLCGDEEEHAVLLWCWLAGLDLNPILLMGDGLPEGPRAAYVFVRLNNEGLLYNASDGMEYSAADPYCPLHTVGLAVTQDNVYANIGDYGAPVALRWDLGEARAWRPLLGQSFKDGMFQLSAEMSSVQPAQLDYIPTSQGLVTELRTSLERRIKLAIDEWRQYSNPRWNFSAAQTLRQLLPELEAGRLGTEEMSRKVKELTDAYEVVGFPLHMGYESTEAVLERVRSTSLHLNFHAEVEFALACHIHAYPNNILSLWIYIASLIRRR